jgi:hypothetical protein
MGTPPRPMPLPLAGPLPTGELVQERLFAPEASLGRMMQGGVLRGQEWLLGPSLRGVIPTGHTRPACHGGTFAIEIATGAVSGERRPLACSEMRYLDGNAHRHGWPQA